MLLNGVWQKGETAGVSAELGSSLPSADLLLQFALQLSELPAVPLLLLLKRRLLRLRSLSQRRQLGLPLAYGAHQTLLLRLQGLHRAVHLLRRLTKERV